MRKHHDVFFYSGFRVQRGQCGAYKQGSVVNVYGAMPKGFLTAGFPRIAAFPNGEGCDTRMPLSPTHCLPLEGKVPRRGG